MILCELGVGEQFGRESSVLFLYASEYLGDGVLAFGALRQNTSGRMLSREDTIHPKLVPYVMAISSTRMKWFIKMTNVKIPSTPTKNVRRLLAMYLVKMPIRIYLILTKYHFARAGNYAPWARTHGRLGLLALVRTAPVGLQ